MNDVLGGQAIASGDLGVSCLAARQEPALVNEIWPGRSMNGAINTAAAKQR